MSYKNASQKKVSSFELVIMFIHIKLGLYACADPGGGVRVWDPLENHKAAKPAFDVGP